MHRGGSKAWMSGWMDECLLSLKANLENYVGQMGKVVGNEGGLFIDRATREEVMISEVITSEIMKFNPFIFLYIHKKKN